MTAVEALRWVVYTALLSAAFVAVACLFVVDSEPEP